MLCGRRCLRRRAKPKKRADGKDRRGSKLPPRHSAALRFFAGGLVQLPAFVQNALCAEGTNLWIKSFEKCAYS